MAASAARVEAAGSRPAQRARRVTGRPRTQSYTAGGVAWIALVSVLLAGVVAMNVAVLRLNLRFDQLAERRQELRAQNAELAARVASAAAAGRIQALARTELGLVPASPEQITYVELGRAVP